MNRKPNSEYVSGIGGAPISRRELIRLGLYGTAGWLFADSLSLRVFAATQPATVVSGPKAKAVIQIWLWGGASH